MKARDLLGSVPLAALDDDADEHCALMMTSSSLLSIDNHATSADYFYTPNNNDNIDDYRSTTTEPDDFAALRKLIVESDALNNNNYSSNNDNNNENSDNREKLTTKNCRKKTKNYLENGMEESTESCNGDRGFLDDDDDDTGDSETTLSGSLEDLVSHFEEKLAVCLNNFAETTETLAPVQIRTQDEIMSESQIWLTLTGNFGNMLPIDWSKTYIRSLQISSLGVTSDKDPALEESNDLDLPPDESLSEALDLHRMVTRHDDWEPPPQSADEVIEEIDEIIMQQSMNSSGFNEGGSDCVMESSVESSFSTLRSPSSYLSQYGFNASINANMIDSCYDNEERFQEAKQATSSLDNLTKMSYKQLVALKLELEALVDIYNEQLVKELATRDELEYEKESKNTFISQLLSVQSKKRHYQTTNRQNSRARSKNNNASCLPQYVTAVIPYDGKSKPLDNRTLQALIKILRAINDNNTEVPAMLTDYILNVFCPSSSHNPIC